MAILSSVGGMTNDAIILIDSTFVVQFASICMFLKMIEKCVLCIPKFGRIPFPGTSHHPRTHPIAFPEASQELPTLGTQALGIVPNGQFGSGAAGCVGELCPDVQRIICQIS